MTSMAGTFINTILDVLVDERVSAALVYLETKDNAGSAPTRRELKGSH